MKQSIFYTALLASIISYSGVATAAAADFTDNGSYTTDNLSGLDWLDVTETANKAYNEVVGFIATPGSKLNGWHYATDQQFIDMVNHYTGAAISDFDKHGVDATLGAQLVELLGDGGSGYTQGLMLDSTASSVVWNGSVNGDYVKAHEHAYPDHDAVGSFDAGSFLVRDSVSAVPLPGTALLLAPALFGFIGFRRKLKA